MKKIRKKSIAKSMLWINEERKGEKERERETRLQKMKYSD